MKRKILYSLFFLCLLFIYFFTFNFFSSPEAIATFKQYSSPNYRLTKDIVSNYINGDRDIEHNIKQTILNNLGYQKWEEYIDFIELQMYIDNVVSIKNPQLIAVLNLSKDLSTVVIFEEANDQYIYKDKLENISRVKEIKFLENNVYGQNLMLIYQVIDEYFGGFFYKEFLEVYVYTNSSFRNLWEQTVYFEENYKESWLNPGDKSNKWNRVIEKTEIEFDFVSALKINTYTEQSKYIAYSKTQPNPKDYTLENKYDFKKHFYWSDQYNTFIMGEVSKDTFLKNMALIKDMSFSFEKLFGIENNNLKIVSENGEVTYLNKYKFGNLFQ